MKKYLFLLTLPLLLVMCKPTSNAPTIDDVSNDVSFNEKPPGTLNWSADAGWTANGTFDKWKLAKFDVSNDDYTKIQVTALVQIKSVNHDDKGLKNHLRENDYLAAKKYPVAKITIDGANWEDGKKRYSTDAVVDLKGATQTVPLTFTVEEGVITQIKGSGMMFREDYNVGDDSGVKNEVGISFVFDVPQR